MTQRRVRDIHVAYVNAVKDFLPPHDAAREASLVISRLTGLSRAQQVISVGDVFEGDMAQFESIVAARLARQPLAQILGSAPFRDRDFIVTQDVLAPRADTETLIDLALTTDARRLLDLGTGPGTIALTLLSEWPDATATASDVSDAALDVAKQNAERFGVTDRVRFIASDWLTDIVGTFDLIVSNPPYVTHAAYETLAPEITRWEPQIALTPGGDGLDAYRSLAAKAPAHLKAGGHLMVEIGHDQGPAVADLFHAAALQNVVVHPDINGKDRVVVARKP